MQAGPKNGSMEVHIHDSPQQPVLVSRKALKSLGAVIDFEANQVITVQERGQEDSGSTHGGAERTPADAPGRKSASGRRQ